MKKALSVFLSVLMLVTSISVVFSLPASAETNLFTDGDFESLDTGYNLIPDEPETVTTGTYKSTANDAGWVKSAGFATATVSEERAHGGTKSLKNSFTYQTFGRVMDVEPNTNYIFSFYYYVPDGNEGLGYAAVNGLDSDYDGTITFTNGMYVNGTVNRLAYTAIGANTVKDNWTKVTLVFDSALNEKVMLSIKANALTTAVYFDDFELINISEATADSANKIYNGDLDDVSSFQTTGNSFSMLGFAGSATGTSTQFELNESAGLPDGVKGNDNAVDITVNYNNTTTGYVDMYGTTTYVLKENTTYEASVWVKTEKMYNVKFYVYEPNYINRDGSQTYNAKPMEGQNCYSYGYDYGSQRVSRSDITYNYRANGQPIDGAGTGPSSVMWSRTGTAAEIESGVCNSDGQYDLSAKFGTEETNGWVKLTMTFTTKSGNWQKDPEAAGPTDLAYSVPVTLGIATGVQNPDKATGAPTTSKISVGAFQLKEGNSATITAENKGGNIVIDGERGFSASATAWSGEQVTVEAEPFAGNIFLGWYKGEELVSTANPYTFTPDGDLTAKFTVNNIYDHPGFEDYDNNKLIAAGNGTASDANWHVGVDYDVTWATITALSSKTENNGTGNVITPYAGERMLSILHRNNDGLYYEFDVEPNTDYAIGIKYMIGGNTTGGQTMAQFGVSVDNDSARAGSHIANSGVITVDPLSWEGQTFLVNSGDNTKLRFNIYYFSMDGSNGFIFLDDFAISKVDTFMVTGDNKESSRIDAVDSPAIDGKAAAGSTYKFKVVSAEAPTEVSVNGTPLTADDQGVYSFVVNGNSAIKVVIPGDEARPEKGKDAAGNDLTKYDKDLYLKSINEGDTVYHEPGLFYTSRTEIKLLYPISEIVSVRSYGLDKYYVEGVDFEVTEDGKLRILEGSSIPVYTGGLTHTKVSGVDNDETFAVSETEAITFIGDTVFPASAVDVTYKHTSTWEDGYQPFTQEGQTDKLLNTFRKLENGEEVNIVVYGDSVSCGWSSSGLNNTEIYDATNTEGSFQPNQVINVAPYAPTWIDMFITRLREMYPDATINLKNLSLGGKDAAWGAENIKARLALWDKEPDLMLVGFGVNDALSKTTATYKANTEALIANARAVAGSDLEFLLIAAYQPNPAIIKFSPQLFLDYEQALEQIAAADSKVGVVNLTSLYQEILKSKEAVDYLNTNVNHGNDFTARMYAQYIIEALSGYVAPPFTLGDTNNDGEVDDNDVAEIRKYLAHWDLANFNTDAADVDGVKGIDDNDVMHFARYLAHWDGYELTSPVTEATFSIEDAAVTAGSDVSIPVNLEGASVYSDGVAGYEFTVTYDADKLEFKGFENGSGFMGDYNETSSGTIKFSYYGDTPITANALLGSLTFTAKTGQSGDAEVTLVVDEVTSPDAEAYDSGLSKGSSATVTIS